MTRIVTQSKVTTKLQVTIPKALAEKYGIRPGDTIQWEPAGGYIRVIPPGRKMPRLSLEERLRMFDKSRQRQREREKQRGPVPQTADRGWTREELYDRGRSG